MGIMTHEEWKSKSDDWRKGWKTCQSAWDIPENPSDEFIAGYKYAIENPFGQVAIPQGN